MWPPYIRLTKGRHTDRAQMLYSTIWAKESIFLIAWMNDDTWHLWLLVSHRTHFQKNCNSDNNTELNTTSDPDKSNFSGCLNELKGVGSAWRNIAAMAAVSVTESTNINYPDLKMTFLLSAFQTVSPWSPLLNVLAQRPTHKNAQI